MQLESQDGGGNAAIVVIKCPKCSTPIRRSNRYTKLLNERAIQIDKVKKKLLGDKMKEQLLVDWVILKQILMEKKFSMPAVNVHEQQVVKAIFKMGTENRVCKSRVRKCRLQKSRIRIYRYRTGNVE
jgi:uncharacterized C2H2 Zn-finger protein